jgi:hypothetical protein
VLQLDQAIIEALWQVVQQPVGGTIEDYSGDERIGVRVSPEVFIITRICDEYAKALDVAFVDVVHRVASLVESFGAEITAGSNATPERASKFNRLIAEILKAAPVELQVHGVQRLNGTEGDHWGALNKATQRALAKWTPSETKPEPKPAPSPAALWQEAERLMDLAEQQLNLIPEDKHAVHDRIDAISKAMNLKKMVLNTIADFPPAIRAGHDAQTAYQEAMYAMHRTGSYGVQFNGPKGWCIIAYGVNPPYEDER